MVRRRGLGGVGRRTGLDEVHVDGVAELDIFEGCEVLVSPVGHSESLVDGYRPGVFRNEADEGEGQLIR